MTGQELANWLGITYNTYKNKIDHHQAKLKDYCDYEKVRGGVIIKEIYISKYNKNLKAEQTKIYLKALSQHDNLITLTGLEAETGLTPYCSRQTRDYLFGDEPVNINPSAHGLIGWRKRIWAIKLGVNKYRNFTKEEEELFDALIQQNYIDKMTPEVVKAQQLILECCIKEGYSAEKYHEILTERNYNFFNDVIERFKELTGKQIGSPTYHEIEHEWGWSTEMDEEYKQFLIKLLDEVKQESES